MLSECRTFGVCTVYRTRLGYVLSRCVTINRSCGGRLKREWRRPDESIVKRAETPRDDALHSRQKRSDNVIGRTCTSRASTSVFVTCPSRNGQITSRLKGKKLKTRNQDEPDRHRRRCEYCADTI